MKYFFFRLFPCLIMLCACSSSQQVTPSSSPLARTKPISTSLPTVLPSPSGNLPGWYKEQSLLWSGYSSPQGGVLGLRAQWIEPQVFGGPNSNLFIWIGVGGWATSDELVQIGTLAYTDTNGHTTHRVWYETVPQLSQLTSMIVYPNDKIAARMELAPGSNQNWTLVLNDLTQNTSFEIKIDYPSSQRYADFIVEDPHLNSTEFSAPLYPFQVFNPVRFTGAQVHYAHGWYSIGALHMMQITMLQNGKTVAFPGDITIPDSFSVAHAASGYQHTRQTHTQKLSPVDN